MKLRTAVRLTGLVVTAATAAVTYGLLLNDEAKLQLKAATRSVGKRLREVQGKFEDLRGIDMEEDLAEENRRHVEEQWRRLGYE